MNTKRSKTIFSILLIVAIVSVVCATNISAKTSIKSKSVKMTAGKATLAVGDIATLSAVMTPANSTDKLTWSSSDKKVATVNSYGVVTAIAEGNATITVKTTAKKTAKCSITVKSILTKAEIEELVKSELLSEESIKKLITDNTISEEAIKKLIAENTLSADDVKKLVKTEITSGSAWTDGVEVPMISDQKLPMLISDPNHTGIIGNIKTIKITKRRMSSNIYKNNVSHYVPYRYDIVMTAEVPTITEAQKTTHYAKLVIGAPNVALQIDSSNDDYMVNYADKLMTEIVAFYSVYDIDEFFIESAIWVNKQQV